MRAVVIAALIALSACDSTQPVVVTIPTDGVHFTGAVNIVYPIAGGGQCVENFGSGNERFMAFDGPAETGEPTVELFLEPYTGRGKYEVDAKKPGGPRLWAEIKALHQWIATSGEIVVTSAGGGVAAGNLRGTGLRDINDGSKVDVVGTWKCAVQDLTQPSPSPSPPPGASPSPLPIGSPVAGQVLAPATEPPVVNLCSTPLEHTADGNARPIFCRDGSLNVLAWRFYAALTPNLLAAGRTATADQIPAAIRADGRYHPTDPEVLWAYDLAAAYYGWTFPHSVVCQAVYSTDNC